MRCRNANKTNYLKKKFKKIKSTLYVDIKNFSLSFLFKYLVVLSLSSDEDYQRANQISNTVLLPVGFVLNLYSVHLVILFKIEIMFSFFGGMILVDFLCRGGLPGRRSFYGSCLRLTILCCPFLRTSHAPRWGGWLHGH